MKPTPLTFARSFEQLRSRLESQPAADLRLLLLAEFWPSLSEFRDDQSYRSYFDEYPSLLTRDISEKCLTDLLPSELRQTLSMTLELRSYHKGNEQAGILRNAVQLLATEAARKFFYVGAVDDALDCLARGYNCGPDTDNVGMALRQAQDDTSLSTYKNAVDDLTELDLLRAVHVKLVETDSPLVPVVSRILRDWEIQRVALSFDEVRCLFVEKNSSGEHTRGRLRSLQGSAEYRRSGATNHELTVDNQIKTPDDPLVGCIHKSLSATVRLLGTSGEGPTRGRFVRARYRVVDSDHTFTGDSVGLAAGLVAYAQLLHPEVHKHERFVAMEAVFTGGLNESGRLTPVSSESLKRKIERAFFSPIRYLVLPQENLETARWCIEEMGRAFPHRQLTLVGATTFREVIDNLNIVRAERVCMGQFVARKAYKYSRATKIQVPIMLVLIWGLLAVISTKTFAPWWFDWHIANIEVHGRTFSTINDEGQVLWESPEFAVPLAEDKAAWHDYRVTVDVNGNGRDELFFAPCSESSLGNVQFYDDEGKLMWEEPAYQRTNYPGDVAYGGVAENLHYLLAQLRLLPDMAGCFVLTAATASLPSRSQIRLFDTAGAVHNQAYLHTGALGVTDGISMDIDGNGRKELVLSGTNNRQAGVAIVVLDPLNLKGVSPPYDNELFLASGMPRGSQLFYVLLPETPLSSAPEVRSVCTFISFDSVSMTWEIRVGEGYGLSVDGRRLMEPLELVSFYYYLDEHFIPIRVVASDGALSQLTDLMRVVGMQPLKEPEALLDSLKSEVVVYHGDSIVHHEAAGIIFDNAAQ